MVESNHEREFLKSSHPFAGFADKKSLLALAEPRQHALDFRRADAMSRDIQHVVDAADDPEITILVLTATVAGEVSPFDFAPVDLLVTPRITPDAAQHVRPRLADDELAAAVGRNF